MISKKVNVNLPADQEARPVAVTVQIASKYESKIYIVANSKKINAKSIMGMMTLALKAGEKLIVEANGRDEEAAIEGIEKYISGQDA